MYYLKNLNINKINLVFGTRAHPDHISGLTEVFYNFEVENLIDPGIGDDLVFYNTYLEAIARHEISSLEVRAGMSVELAKGLNFEIIHPVEPLSDHLNNESIVGQLRYNDIGFLFTEKAS